MKILSSLAAVAAALILPTLLHSAGAASSSGGRMAFSSASPSQKVSSVRSAFTAGVSSRFSVSSASVKSGAASSSSNFSGLSNTNIAMAGTVSSSSNTASDSNAGPAFQDELDMRNADPSKNIVFDSYDEVSIRTYDSNKISEVKFIGNVKIRFDKNELRAKTVVVQVKDKKVLDITAWGSAEFRFGGDVYLCDTMNFNPDTKMGVLKNVRSFMKNGADNSASPLAASRGWFYRAKKANIYSQDRISLEEAHFTFTADDYPHYEFYADKIWYFKNEIMFTWNNTYRVGQGDFFYFPFFFRWEKATGLKTAFGNSKWIGYYLLNSFNFNPGFGDFKTGLDFYELLGNYAFLDFSSRKQWGPFSTLNLNVRIADDQRVTFDAANQRYRQLVDDGSGKGIWTNVRQFGWYYRATGSLSVGGAAVNFNWEDLNDPFFRGKYESTREDTFDIKKLIQPQDNLFYGGGRNDGAAVSTLSRGFDLTYNNFRMSASWTYQQQIHPEVTNTYLNDRYWYALQSHSFPTLSYNFGNLDLITNLDFSIPVTRTLQISNTNFILGIDEDLAPYINVIRTNAGVMPTNQPFSGLSNASLPSASNIQALPAFTTVEPGKASDSNLPPADIAAIRPELNSEAVSNLDIATDTNAIAGETISNIDSPEMPETNSSPVAPGGNPLNVTWSTLSNYRVTTNRFVVYSVRSSINGNFGFTSSETLDTNGKPTYDRYSHNENGSYSLNINMLNSQLSLNNSLSFNNNKVWSGFPVEMTNNLLQTAMTINLGSTLNLANQNFMFGQGAWYNGNVNFNSSASLNWDAYRATPLASAQIRYVNSSQSAGTGFNWISNNVSFSLSLNHSIQWRDTNGIVDNYINNVMRRNVSVVIGPLKVFWLSVGFPGPSLDLMETNNSSNVISGGVTNQVPWTNNIQWTFEGLTNRWNLGRSYPLSFTLNHPFPFLGPVSYVYDILQQSNKSIGTSFSYSVNALNQFLMFYKVDVFSVSGNLGWNFENPRLSLFSMSLNTTVWFSRDWKLTYSTQVRNSKLFLYFANDPAIAKFQLAGEQGKNFFEDLWQGLNILDYNGLKQSYFKIQNLNFSLVHYINEWEMDMNLTISRRVDSVKRIAFWDPSIEIKFVLIGTSDQFPPITKHFIPAEYQ